MALLTPVDTEGAVRTWARAQADIAAVVGNGVWFGIPVGAVFPLITVARVGGGARLQDGGGWIDNPLIQFDCWGSSESAKAEAMRVAVAVQTAVLGFRDGTEMTAGAVGMWALAESGPLWAPDPESGRARYVLDVSFGIRAG